MTITITNTPQQLFIATNTQLFMILISSEDVNNVYFGYFTPLDYTSQQTLVMYLQLLCRYLKKQILQLYASGAGEKIALRSSNIYFDFIKQFLVIVG